MREARDFPSIPKEVCARFGFLEREEMGDGSREMGDRATCEDLSSKTSQIYTGHKRVVSGLGT